MNNDAITQAEWSIQRERDLWSALIDHDDGTPAHWEQLVRRSAPHVTRAPFFPRWQAGSAFTPSGQRFNSQPDIYGLTDDLAEEWRGYAGRWEAFLDLNPKARIAAMLSDVSESHDASSFPYGWEQVVRGWAQDDFPDPKPFDDRLHIVTDAWKGQLRDAMQRAGAGWVVYGEADVYEWREPIG